MHEHSNGNLTGNLSSDIQGKNQGKGNKSRDLNFTSNLNTNSKEKITNINNNTNENNINTVTNNNNHESNNNNNNIRIPFSGQNNINNNSKEITESQKRIKIKINPFISGEEVKGLLKEENHEMNNNKDLERTNLEKINKQREIDKNKEKMEKDKLLENSISSRQRSSISKSSVDSASFNKLKNGILEKKEVSAIKFMKYLSFAFLLGTILLILFSAQENNQKFSRLNDYMLQNLYFNHSKISVSCVYLSSLNLKLIKNNIYSDSRCYMKCTDFYSSMLKRCVTDIKTEKENATNFFDDFKYILNSQKEISLYLLNFTEKNTIKIDIENNLNLIVSYGLKLNSNINDYYKYPYSVLDVISKNIIEQSLLYINDVNISGFNDTQKALNLENSYISPINMLLIIEAGIFSILLFFFVIFIVKLYSLENFYLRKLIQFKNPPFEIYLKSLDDIKKKLRNDNEDEDKFDNDLEMQDFDMDENVSNRSNNHKNKNKNKKKKNMENNSEEENKQENENKENNQKKKDKKRKKDKKIKEEEEKEKEKKKKGLNRKNNKNKKNAKNYQDEKIKVMGKYFLTWNILFAIKVIVILLLSATYYLVVSIIDKSILNDMLSFDFTTNSIEGVYKESFMIYLSLKTELAKYIDFELEKKKASEEFYLLGTNIKKLNVTVNFGNNIFYDPESLMNSSFYRMKIPFQLDTPKIGTLLMPIISTDLTAASNVINSLNNLYNIDACAELFDKNILDNPDYKQCAGFWSSILLKGMEQSITQMSIVITSVLDDLNSLNQNSKSLSQILQKNSVFMTYEQFMELYLFNSYMKTVEIFKNLNNSNLKVIYATYQSTMIGYICFVIILFGFLIYFVYKSKNIFNTFMNFIGIFPVKYLLEDSSLYKEILKLEQYIYY